MKLTDSAIRNAKPGVKTRKLFDGGGLYLEVTPAGSKRWRWKYRYGGKEKLLSMGVYPATGLKEARARREEARKHLAEGADPSALRRAHRLVTGWLSRYTASAVVERSAEQNCASGPSLFSPDGFCSAVGAR